MKLTFRSISIAALLVLNSLGAPATAAGETTCGTLNNGVYEIGSVADLQCLATGDPVVRGVDRAYAQTVDLDLSGVANWQPIGASYDDAFAASYDGRGHKISNLKISVGPTSSVDGIGLFGWASGLISNFALVGAQIAVDSTGGAYDVGGLVGNAAGTLTKVAVTGVSVTVTGVSIGSIGGLAGISADVAQSSAAGTITATATADASAVGGLTGSGAAVSNDYAAVTVTVNAPARTSVGGLAGEASAVTNSYSVGSVVVDAVAEGEQVGGLVGAVGGDIISSYRLDTVCTTVGCNTLGGALSSSQLQVMSNFAGWDFGSAGGGKAAKAKSYPGTSKRPGGAPIAGVWGMCASVNSGRPHLVWQLAVLGWSCAV